jgi:MFS family permease
LATSAIAGRKVTLVASLLTMGISTVVIGLLPGYESIGILAPMLLALARFGQGLGLGGEWGGAALLATENALRANARCTALSRSWARLSASSSPTAPSCCSPGC